MKPAKKKSRKRRFERRLAERRELEELVTLGRVADRLLKERKEEVVR